MTPLLVCILSPDNGPLTERAVASARALGLPARIGLTRLDIENAPASEAEIVAIPWQDDFAAARNALAADANARYLLWLDSDEILDRFPAADWSAEQAPWLAVTIEDRADMAPRAIVRIQRNDGRARWQHAVHEELVLNERETPGTLRILEGALIRHSGYDDDAVIAAKLARNARIVAAERAKGRDYYALALEEARLAEARGPAALAAWRAAFAHPDGAPRQPGGYDRRVEAARALADAGESAPAKQLLAANPAIADLHLALLEADYRATGRFDDARLDTLAALITQGSADLRYAYPAALRDAGRDRIIAWIKEANDAEPGESTTRSAPMSDSLYHRSEQCDQETLEGDLIVMNTENFEVVTLNETAQAVWEVLANPVDVEDIVAIFAEAFPAMERDELRGDIESTLQTLLDAELVVIGEPSEPN
jgi:hypothetical protein